MSVGGMHSRADANGATASVSMHQPHITRPHATRVLMLSPHGRPIQRRMRGGKQSHLSRCERRLRSTLPSESSASMSTDEVTERGAGSNQGSSGRNSMLDFLGRAQVLVPTAAEDDAAAEGDEQLEGGPVDWLVSHDGLRDSCEAGDGQALDIAVLLSGGVDSSLALQLLHAAGHRVRAFYLQIWFQEDFRNFWDSCPWEEDLSYAKKVCESLGVELEVVPMTDKYWDKVVGESVNSIRRGLTPNPDILCNSRVKFGAFCEHLEEKYPRQFDRVASGHYARSLREPGHEASGGVKLAMTPDDVKDQTYFLAQLRQDQLSRAMFPLGPLTKAEVRQMARAAGLATQGRKDSQGICFLGKVKFSEFIKEHLGEWPGLILEEETGEQLGFHKGFWFHTIGQRSGLLLPDGPWYVVRKDMDMNVVYVSKHYYSDDKERRMFQVGYLNWINGQPPLPEDGPIQCKVRHGPKIYSCSLRFEVPHRALVEIDRNDQGLAAGQYAVFYQNNTCFGCGMILPRHQEQRQQQPSEAA